MTDRVDSNATQGILPHGGKLVNRLVEGDAAADLARRAKDFPKLRLDERSRADLECVATGVLSPLEGFIGKKDYDSVVDTMRLASGVPFSIPITLAVPKDDAAKYPVGRDVALTLPETGAIAGVIHVEEQFELDKAREARNVYRTEERTHPGVAWLYDRTGDVALGGKVTLLERSAERKFPTHHRDPVETRGIFAERGWRRVVAFQTRNPVHRAHEYLIKCALEAVDGLMLHPLVGETKSDDVPAVTRIRCYETLLENYFPARIACCCRCFRLQCATPGRARRSCTPSQGRTTAAPTSSWGAITPASAITTARTMPIRSSTSSRRASSRSRRSSSNTAFTAARARSWPAARRARTPTSSA